MNIGTLIKDWLINIIYLHRIVISAIISYVSIELFNFIITTAVAYRLKMEYLVVVCRITWQARTLPSQWQTQRWRVWFQHLLFQSIYDSCFSKNYWNLISSSARDLFNKLLWNFSIFFSRSRVIKCRSGSLEVIAGIELIFCTRPLGAKVNLKF